MPTFVLVNPNGQAYPIEPGETSFGRQAGCTYYLQDPQISRLHATLTLEADVLVVRDENSANGTFVNGQRIAEPTTLADGDTLRIGDTVLTVRGELAPAHTVAATGPPSAVRGQSPASTMAPVKQAARRSRFLLYAAGCLLLLLCLFAGVAGAFLMPQLGLQDRVASLLGRETYTLEDALADESIDDRQEVLGYLGLPDAFTISQVVVDGVPLRMETWRYHDFGLRVDFVEGEVAWTIDIEPVPEDTIFAAWYNPLEFELGMSPSEAARVATAASPAGMTPESIDLAEGGDDLAGASMLVGDQIVIGLGPEGVMYVETVAMFPAEGG
ncbi:MAG TPA: FHA domain-containing protein [Anaerolineales bacterium]